MEQDRVIRKVVGCQVSWVETDSCYGLEQLIGAEKLRAETREVSLRRLGGAWICWFE